MVSAHTTPSNIPFLILESDFVYVMHVKDAYYVAEAASGRIKVNPVFWFPYHVNICLAISET